MRSVCAFRQVNVFQSVLGNDASRLIVLHFERVDETLNLGKNRAVVPVNYCGWLYLLLWCMRRNVISYFQVLLLLHFIYIYLIKFGRKLSICT